MRSANLKRAAFGLGMSLSVHALAAVPPSAGSAIQQVPPAPVAPNPLPEIKIHQGATPASVAHDHQKFPLSRLHVAGAHAYPEAELVSRSGFKPGEFTLADLRGIAAKIADFYHRQGYFVAQAYLPAQEISDGAVTIAVIEGRYGNVTIKNKAHLADSLPDSIIAGLDSGDTISVSPLEERLLLLSDLPGVDVKSTLIPGTSVGSSDLIIHMNPGRRITGSIDADNEGNRYTGANRIGATVNLNEPSGHGDVASLRALSSGAGLNYGRASYQLQIGRARAGTAYTDMRYALGSDFSSLLASGTAKIASIFGSYPLMRSRSRNLSAQIDYDAKSFHDTVASTAAITDKKANVWLMSLNGDNRDGSGITNYSLTWTDGSLDIESPVALANDSTTAHSNGHYDKLSYNAARLQQLTESTSLFAAISGQYAAKNLDLSEKMELGGANAVRAYPEGEAYSDQGYVVNIEARRAVRQGILPGQFQFVGFIDTGRATQNKNPWAAGQNSRTLSGTGIGINWAADARFLVKSYFAHKVGNALATSAPDSMNRFWVQAVKFF
jgi:hemolysin activation/secretion protein